MCNYKRVWAEIDLAVVKENIEKIHEQISANSKILAVIKADGYGHGAVQIAKTIESLDYVFGYAVATVEEGMVLRDDGIKKPILILGYTFPEQYEEILYYELTPTVFTKEMALEFSKMALKLGKICKIHIAVDTGMGRIGYRVTQDAVEEIEQLSKFPNICIEGIFTHFAKADEKDKDYTYKQILKYNEILEMLHEKGIDIPIHHCSNSAGIIDVPQANMDLVRAGIIIYGLWPSEEVNKEVVAIKPILTLKSRVAYVKDVPVGTTISYGGTYITKEKRRIATIPVGYADGYARGLSNNGDVLIKGKRAPICGRICMDQFMVDVTDIENVYCGDEVVLIGKMGENSITMEELANRSGRLNYEFACNVSKRVPRVYKNNVNFEF